MGFRGWPESAFEFFAGLELDNSKAYWAAHREVYERDVRGPLVALTDQLAGRFGEARLFRPYRDTRFSADKSPYKTTAAAMVGHGYVQISAAGLMVGAGYYHLEADQLARYRAAVADDRPGSELDLVVTGLRRSGLEVVGSGALKTAPRGYPADHPRIELLRLKGLVAMRSWPPTAWMATAAARRRVEEVLETTQPLVDWLDRRVGPAGEPSLRPGRRS